MKYRIIISLAIAACMLCGCGKSTLETTYTSQAEKIQTYIDKQLSSNPEYRVAYNKGVARLVVKEGEGPELEPKGIVAFRYAGYNFTNSLISSSTLFATNDEETAKSNRWEVSDESLYDIAVIELGKDDIVEGLRLGLAGVRAGEECYVMFSGKYGFGKRQSGTIPANAAIAYHLNILEINN